jgi:FkbM family methyltransferase
MVNTLKFIVSHPLNKANKAAALLRFVQWQVRSRMSNGPMVHPFTEKSKLYVSKGETGATGNVYCGLHEFYDMGFLLHLLRPTDLFVDIGANIGSYTILATAEIGATTISIEPVPATFKRLTANIDLNRINKHTQPLNIALGKEQGVLRFTKSFDTVNHVATEQETDTIDVPVDTLDNILQQNNPILLKIDVEGFETEVLNGAAGALANESLKAIIIELNGSGNRYGYNEELIHTKLTGHGFQPFDYDPFTRKLTPRSSFNDANTIYIRDTQYVADRVKNARKVSVLGQAF